MNGPHKSKLEKKKRQQGPLEGPGRAGQFSCWELIIELIDQDGSYQLVDQNMTGAFICFRFSGDWRVNQPHWWICSNNVAGQEWGSLTKTFTCKPNVKRLIQWIDRVNQYDCQRRPIHKDSTPSIPDSTFISSNVNWN